MTYDPEVPAGYQDADLEQAAYEAQAQAIADARRQGICVHGWWQNRPDGSVVCLEEGCGQTFVDAQAHQDCRDAALREVGV